MDASLNADNQSHEILVDSAANVGTDVLSKQGDSDESSQEQNNSAALSGQDKTANNTADNADSDVSSKQDNNKKKRQPRSLEEKLAANARKREALERRKKQLLKALSNVRARQIFAWGMIVDAQYRVDKIFRTKIRETAMNILNDTMRDRALKGFDRIDAELAAAEAKEKKQQSSETSSK